MDRDQLFVIKPDFSISSSKDSFYCPGCAEALGLLHYYPDLKQHVDVRYVPFERPRPEVVELIGEENQDSPVLVLANPKNAASTRAKVQEAKGRFFINDLREIGIYLADAYAIGFPYPPEA